MAKKPNINSRSDIYWTDAKGRAFSAYKFEIEGAGHQEYYRMDDAADLLGLSRRTMRHRCKTGMIPSYKTKGRVFIPAPFVDRTRRQGWSF